MTSGALVPDATAVVAGVAAVVRVRTGPATKEPTVPIVMIAGAMRVRRMRMIPPCVHRGQSACDLDPAARTGLPCPCFFIHQSSAWYNS